MKLSFVLASYAAFAALLLGFSGKATDMAKGTVALASAHEIQNALELYNLEHGEYPRELSELVPQYLTVPENGSLDTVRYAQTASGATYSLKVVSP